jgi:hypothetical protein
LEDLCIYSQSYRWTFWMRNSPFFDDCDRSSFSDKASAYGALVNEKPPWRTHMQLVSPLTDFGGLLGRGAESKTNKTFLHAFFY